MGHIGNIDHLGVQNTINETFARIHAAGRTPGYIAANDTVAHYAQMGVRCFLTGTGDWIALGADYLQKAQNSLG